MSFNFNLLNLISVFDSLYAGSYKIDIGKETHVIENIKNENYESLKSHIRGKLSFAHWFGRIETFRKGTDGHFLKYPDGKLIVAPERNSPGYSISEFSECYAEACINTVLSAIAIKIRDCLDEEKIKLLLREASSFIKLSSRRNLDEDRVVCFFEICDLIPE